MEHVPVVCLTAGAAAIICAMAASFTDRNCGWDCRNYGLDYWLCGANFASVKKVIIDRNEK